MKSKKIILLLTSLVSMTASVFAVSLTGQETNAFFDPSTEVWGHYDQVLPGEGTPGCKEFWISCSSHEILFEEPTSGRIEDRGQPSLAQIQSWKNDGTDRYIYYVGDTLHFGSYPQSQEIDQETINLLNQNKDEWITLDEYNNEPMETPYMFYKDIDLNNDGKFDYRGIYLTAYRDSMHYSSPTTSSNYQKNYGFEKNVNYWFKYEPIEWVILEKKDGNYKLLCNCAIDDVAYSIGTKSVLYDGNHYIDYQGDVSGDNIAHNNYKFSDIRNFLNTSFYFHAFSNDEKQLIKEVRIDNSVDSIYWDNPTNYCEDTYDKVTLLSRKEAYNTNWGFLDTYALYKQNGNSYLNGSDITTDEKKQRFTTDYAKSLGAYIYTFDERWYGTADWFLRSPSSRPNDDDRYVYCIRSRGHAEETINIESTFASVVPVITVGEREDDLIYSYKQDGTYEVVGCQTQNPRRVFIPETYNGKPVTSIADNLFRDSNSLRVLDISKNVKTIGNGSFYNCLKLEHLVLHNGLKTISSNAFTNCSLLKTISIPDSVTTLGNYCFAGCSGLKYLRLSSNIQTIPEYSFNSCSSVEILKLGEHVSSICSYAFADCTNLKIVHLPATLSCIEKYAFLSCDSLSRIYYYGTQYQFYGITIYDYKLYDYLSYYSDTEPDNFNDSYWYFDENNNIKEWMVYGTTVQFGRYPQSEVTDQALISSLTNKYLKYSSIYYLTSDMCYYYFGDVDVDNDKLYDYRYLVTYTENFETFTKWFKYEPIEWRIVSTGDYYELLSTKMLFISRFDKLDYEDNQPSYFYEDSNLRSVLNNDFKTRAFSTGELSNMEAKGIDYNYDFEIEGDYISKHSTLNDYIFLPSSDYEYYRLFDYSLPPMTDYCATIRNAIIYDRWICDAVWLRDSESYTPYVYGVEMDAYYAELYNADIYDAYGAAPCISVLSSVF